jgi:hypothetical protein
MRKNELAGLLLVGKELAGNHSLGLHLAGTELASKGNLDLQYENSTSR